MKHTKQSKRRWCDEKQKAWNKRSRFKWYDDHWISLPHYFFFFRIAFKWRDRFIEQRRNTQNKLYEGKKKLHITLQLIIIFVIGYFGGVVTRSVQRIAFVCKAFWNRFYFRVCVSADRRRISDSSILILFLFFFFQITEFKSTTTQKKKLNCNIIMIAIAS